MSKWLILVEEGIVVGLDETGAQMGVQKSSAVTSSESASTTEQTVVKRSEGQSQMGIRQESSSGKMGFTREITRITQEVKEIKPGGVARTYDITNDIDLPMFDTDELVVYRFVDGPELEIETKVIKEEISNKNV